MTWRDIREGAGHDQESEAGIVQTARYKGRNSLHDWTGYGGGIVHSAQYEWIIIQKNHRWNRVIGLTIPKACDAMILGLGHTLHYWRWQKFSAIMGDAFIS